MKQSDRVKDLILQQVKKYFRFTEEEKHPSSKINYAGRIYDEKELVNLVNSSLDFWLTNGEYTQQFEQLLCTYLDIKYSLFVNSGSSANLLAFSCLTSPLLKERQIKRGDEVITVACGFPTTVAPIIQYGAIPVFVDVDLNTANIDTTQLSKALSSKTKAVMIAHTLGNPFDLDTVVTFCNENNLWLIEDNCDSLGSLYKEKLTGTFGDIGTSSFYPPHHITTGEGGAVYTNNPLLNKIMLSIRDWGRDCICSSGEDNKCGKRFSGQYGDLPEGFDHKYVYSHLGYNLKATDLQAAIGCAQIKKIQEFNLKRKDNHFLLQQIFKKFEDYFILHTKEQKSDPAWFGFFVSVKDSAPFTRNDIVSYLEKNNIQTRMLFAGNIIKQPCFNHLSEGEDYKVVGDLKNTNIIMNTSFWIGVYFGITLENIEYIKKVIETFIGDKINE